MRSGKIGAAAVLGAFAVLGASGALAAGLPKVPTYTGPPSHRDFKARPSSITYTGDGSGFLAGQRRAHSKRAAPLNWSSWTTSGAQGSGYNWVDNCNPSCAAGTFHRYPVKLGLYRPRNVHGHRIFTRMRVTYTGTEPGRVKRVETWKVVYSSGTYSWSFPVE